MATDFDYHNNKKTDKIYISKSFENKNPISDEIIKTRQISKVFDVSNFHFFEYLKEYKSVVLRKTDKEREEVKITVIEDGKKVSGISIQRFMVKSGHPKAESFFFTPEEFGKMIELLRSIEFINFSNPSHFQITDKELKEKTSELVKILEKIPKGKIDSNTLGIILEKIGSNDKINGLLKSLSEEEKNILSTNHEEIKKKRVLKELSTRLEGDFSETTGDDSWQKWIFDNCWITGSNYMKAIEKQKISITGIMPDYLFPTNDGFVDILEIKLPKHYVLKKDDSHKGAWVWSSEVNKAIGQVINYIGEIDRQCLEIEREILRVYHKKITLLKPRAYILIGNDDKWYQEEESLEIRKNKRGEKLAGLRKLNGSLHGIEVITYAELSRRGNTFIKEIN